VNAWHWQRAARLSSWDLAAPLAEYVSVDLDPWDTGRDLYGRFTDASARRNLRAFKIACEEIRREAERRMLARAGSEDRAKPP
jgi:hypothetical protein